MSFLKHIFSRKTELKKAEETISSPAKTLAAQISERLRTHTSRTFLKLTPEPGSAGLFESKIGGSFYVPEDMLPPTDSASKPMYLLAQLNFSELPSLEDFPEKGLLQFFLTGSGEAYGANFDAPTEQTDWCVRYLPEFPDERNTNETRIFHPKWSEDTNLPLIREDTYSLKASTATQSITLCDYRISDTLRRTCADLLPEDFRDIYDLDDDVSSELLKEQELYSCQIGGYPDFTQYDPREDAEDAPDFLLFQLETTDNILWGTSGVGNFFIRSEDLKNKDFSRVWYHWDGC
ncbi:MAG: DUF1963 domain-containing protein [Lachnospiraceae bacterium]|nr:DUF1963 domain-containing protein [Lachnospiraceae bacterium]